MIRICVNDEMFAYDMYHITKAFCPEETIEQQVDVESPKAVRIELETGESAVLEVEHEEIQGILDRKMKKRYANLTLYRWLSTQTGKQLAWGILTGVRPTKLIMTRMEDGMSEQEVAEWMRENYQVTDEKIDLGIRVAKKEKEQLSQLDYEEGYSLYIGIPFCPTTCSYCSFTSTRFFHLEIG